MSQRLARAVSLGLGALLAMTSHESAVRAGETPVATTTLVAPPSFVPAPSPAALDSAARAAGDDFLLGAPSLSGSTGLLHAATATMGRPGELRLGLRGRYFSATNFLGPADSDHRLAGDLVWSLNITPSLELFGNLGSATNRNERTRQATDLDPEVIRTGGHLVFGAKAGRMVAPRLSLAAEAALRIGAGPSDLLVAFGETSWWLGPMLSYDGIDLWRVPFRAHLAINYFADHSRDLGAFAMDSLAARQAFRFAYGMSPGRFRSTLALELPILFAAVVDPRSPRSAVVVPFVEYSLDRLVGGADATFKEYDAPACATMCSDARVQTTWTLGVRARVYGALAVELGLDLRGRSASLRYGPPQPPHELVFGLQYPLELDGQAHGRLPVPPSSEAPTPPRPPSETGGAQSAATGAPGALGAMAPVAAGSGAGSTLAGGTATPGASRTPAGTPQFEPTAGIRPTGGSAPGSGSSTGPAGNGGREQPSGAAAPPPPPDAQALQALRLDGRGQVRGRVSDPTGRGLQAALLLRGPRQSAQAATDGQGGFALQLLPGRYRVRVQSPGFELQEMDVELTIGADTRLDVRLQPPADDPSVQLQAREIKLGRSVRFVEGRVELTADSQLLLKSAADVLGVHPEITQLRIVAHTDGEPTAEADALTLQQAEAVRAFLIGRGVAESRLSVRGAGAREPLVPSTTPVNRARNRRVELQLAP